MVTSENKIPLPSHSVSAAAEALIDGLDLDAVGVLRAASVRTLAAKIDDVATLDTAASAMGLAQLSKELRVGIEALMGGAPTEDLLERIFGDADA